jgi:hypothetical protein
MAITETVTQTKLPQWLVDAYTKSIERGYEATTTPYQAYTGGPRLAAVSPQEQQAYQMTSQNVGNYQPYTQAAGDYIAGGTQSFTDPGVAASYMNPYTQNVVSGIGAAAGRNLYENLLPAVNRTFIGGGTFGGSRSGEFTARTIRDANAAALSAQNEALQKGYESGMGQFNTEAGRYLTAAEQARGLGRDVQNLAGVDTAALEAAGSAQRGFEQESLNLAKSDFDAQRDYDYNQALRFQNFVGTPSAQGSGTRYEQAPGVSKTASTIGAVASGIGALSNLFGGPKKIKDGGPVGADGKRNIKHPMHGLGWLKGK